MENRLATVEELRDALFTAGEFDENLYCKLFADVREGVERKDFQSGYSHWSKVGFNEVKDGLRTVPVHVLEKLICTIAVNDGRPLDPKIYKNFDREAYLLLNPDVRAANGNPLEHWINHGRKENRKTVGVAPFASRQVDIESVSDKPAGMNVFGLNNEPTGLGKASRGFCAAINSAEIKSNYHEVNVSYYKPSAGVEGRKLSDEQLYRVSVILQNADMMQKFESVYDVSDYDATYKIGAWVWELPQFRSDWATSFGSLDEIWVPSTFCRDAIAPMTVLPVTVIPYVVSVSKPVAKFNREYFKLPQDRFIFAYIFDVSSTIARKNPYALIRAFKLAFPPDEKVNLVLKFHASRDAEQELRALKIAVADDSRIMLINSVFTDAENDGFKRCIDCFVSPHRSEGFGLNIAEMLLLGKPVIATGYSGNEDFFNDEFGYPIKYKMIEIEKWIGPYAPGMTWADPDCSDMARLMKHVLNNPTEANAKALSGQKFIRQNYSTEAIALKIKNRIKELGFDKEIPQWIRSLGKTSTAESFAPIAQLVGSSDLTLFNSVSHRPLISIIVPVYNIAPTILQECINSVLAQTYPEWELCLVDDCSTKQETRSYLRSLVGEDSRYRVRFLAENQGISGAMNEAVQMASGEFIAFLDNDDVIHPDALMRVVQEISFNPSVDVLYSDEVKLDENGKLCDSYFKPDFSLEHLESVMYWLHFFVVRKRLFHNIGGFRPEYAGAQDYDLALRLSLATRRIAHIDAPLYCWRKIPGSASATILAKPKAMDAGMEALKDYAKIKYNGMAVVQKTACIGIYNLRKYAMIRPPVTLVICTDNRSKDIEGRGYINMLANFHQSILQKTSYRNYRILIAANGFSDVESGRSANGIETKVIHYREPAGGFNFSKKINWVVAHVETEYMVILNDDMEIFEPMWLDYLLDQIQDPDVGVVGAKLLTSLGTIQHTGAIISNDGAVKHVYHGFIGSFIGYNGYTHTIRNFSAVTGACIATKKSLFEDVNGFDEELAIDYNDIDFCLRIGELGLRIVMNPNAMLFHFENATVPRTKQNPEETALFGSRWSDLIKRDPYYNKNLSQIRHDYADADTLDAIYNARHIIPLTTTGVEI